MGIFDIFKKSADDNAMNETDLELTLRKAMSDPESRGAFYEKLLKEKLFLIIKNTDAQDGKKTLNPNESVNVVAFSDGRIPVFTSKIRVFEKGIIKGDVPTLKVSGEKLFTTMQGATFVLNPYSDTAKVLYPEEVAGILLGSNIVPEVSKETLPKGANVQIGQPAVFPTEMVNALQEVLLNLTNVSAAYLGWIYNPNKPEEPPHYIFGLDFEGDPQAVAEAFMKTVKKYISEDELVDFMKINPQGGGLNDYFLKHTQPIFKR